MSLTKGKFGGNPLCLADSFFFHETCWSFAREGKYGIILQYQVRVTSSKDTLPTHQCFEPRACTLCCLEDTPTENLYKTRRIKVVTDDRGTRSGSSTVLLKPTPTIERVSRGSGSSSFISLTFSPHRVELKTLLTTLPAQRRQE